MARPSKRQTRLAFPPTSETGKKSTNPGGSGPGRTRTGTPSEDDTPRTPAKSPNFAVVIYSSPRRSPTDRPDRNAPLPTPLTSAQPIRPGRRASSVWFDGSNDANSIHSDESVGQVYSDLPTLGSQLPSEASTPSFKPPGISRRNKDPRRSRGSVANAGSDGLDVVDLDTSTDPDSSGRFFRKGVEYVIPVTDPQRDRQDELEAELFGLDLPPRAKRAASPGQEDGGRKKAKARAVPARTFIAGGTSGYAPLPDRVNRTPASAKKASRSAKGSKSGGKKSEKSSRKAKQVMREGQAGRSKRGDVEGSTSVETEGDTDEDEEVASPLGTRRLYSRKGLRAVENARPDLDDDDDADDDSDDVIYRSSGRQPNERPVIKSSPEGEEVDDEEDDVIPSSARRSRPRAVASREKRSPNVQRRLSRSDKKDLEEDIKVLAKTSATKSRTRGKVKSERDKKQKHLELLRRRRAGEKIDHLSSTSPDTGPRRGIYDSESGVGSLGDAGEEDDEEPEDNGLESVRRSLRYTRRNLNDEDFVVQDEDTLGVPVNDEEEGMYTMPFQFTRHAHKKPEAHFKDAIEWLVHNQLNPAFARNDPVYVTAFRKLDAEVEVYCNSRFISSVWKEDFVRALRARPDFLSIETPTEGESCEACGRSGHSSAFTVQFEGKPYHRETLEDVSDDDEDEDEDAKSLDSQGRSIPGESKRWEVGVTCKANAETAHQLTHWRYALKGWVTKYLDENEHVTESKIIERSTWTTKRKRDYANEVVDTMAAAGEIGELYAGFERALRRVRTGMEDGSRRRERGQTTLRL